MPLQTPRARPRVAVVSGDHDAAAVWRKRCEEKDRELDALAREAEARLRRATDDVRRAEDAAQHAETEARRAAAALERQDAAARDGRVDALGAARAAVDEERRKAARDLRQTFSAAYGRARTQHILHAKRCFERNVHAVQVPVGERLTRRVAEALRGGQM